ncbi:MAG: thiamine pyrophosphate-dependent enzyme [Candidatus Helarchaeota archaeon]
MTESVNERVVMLGNQAIIRGALEAGVQFVSQYPGTPLSDIGTMCTELLRSKVLPGFYFQWAANEAASIQAAAGASWSGIRSMVPAKHVGINVLADSLCVIALNGPTSSYGEGGIVIIAGGDPASLGSHCEQNERFYSWMFHLLHMEPSDVKDCLEWIPELYTISQEFDLVGFFRVTSRVAHTRQDVIIKNKLPKFEDKKGYFEKNIPKYCSLPPHCVNNHVRLYERMDKFKKSPYSKKFNKIIPGDSKLGIITAGVPFGYTMEALRILNIRDTPVLKYGVINPLDEDQFLKFSENLDKIIIIEELEPFIETQIKRIAQENGVSIPIKGHEIVRKWGELSTSDLVQILGKEINREISTYNKILDKATKYQQLVPPRPPTFCAGCPERSLLYAIDKAVDKKKTIIAGDIGCYVMSFFPPHELTDWVICMSGGLGAAVGASIKTNQDIIAFVGDSTFYHTGLPILISAVYNGANVTLIIFDNSWTAMTGGHENPNTPPKLRAANLLENPIQFDLKAILKACGVKYVRVIDPYKPKSAIHTIMDAMKHKGIKAIISRRECGLRYGRRLRAEKYRWLSQNKPFSQIIYQVIPERCELCKECTQILCCTALSIEEKDGIKCVQIDEARCNRCGVCFQICPNSAIRMTVINPQDPEVRV